MAPNLVGVAQKLVADMGQRHATRAKVKQQSAQIGLNLGNGLRHHGQGFFYKPTVVAGARQDDEIVRSEVFCPVVSVSRITDAEQAIAGAHDSEYGLASAV